MSFLFSGGLFDVIPDSAVHRYDVSDLSVSDGNTVSTLPDLIGGADLTGGSPTVNTSVAPQPVLYFDSIDDVLESALDDTYTLPTTIIAVGAPIDDDAYIIEGDVNAANRQLIRAGGSVYEAFAGNVLTGGSFSSGSLRVFVFRASTTASEVLFRVNGSTVADNISQSEGIEYLKLGQTYDPSVADDYRELYWGEAIVCDGLVSISEIQSVESSLQGKWGI